MITVEEYLEAKKVVDAYTEQLNIPLVIWRCNRNLSMMGGTTRVFTKGKTYNQIERNLISAIDDEGEIHSLGEWEKHFTAI